jgi:hypothetical protein
MKKRMRFLVCASTAALILGAAPIGAVIAPAQAQVEVSVTAGVAPPLLPVYDQPPILGPGYLWIPGYWAWDGYEYYWTPGYWATPPAVGLYWTPPYWSWTDGAYTFYPGYWAPTVGFYGGIDYGFGYTGVGYQGGYWQNNQFVYNSAANNFGSANIVNAYSRPVSNPNNRVAFNAGAGRTMARPTQAQIAARAHGMPPTAAQAQHQATAGRDPALRFNANHGQPRVAAVQRANEFHGTHAAAATNAPAERPQAAAPTPPVRPEVAQAPSARPQVAQHASAAGPQVGGHTPPARPEVTQHAPLMRQHYAYHAPVRHAVVAPRRFAYHAPERHVARPHFAYHAPTMHAPIRHELAARPHFAYHAPAMRMAQMGGMHMGGAPHFGGMRVGGGPHIGGTPHFGGGPHVGGGGHRHVP